MESSKEGGGDKSDLSAEESLTKTFEIVADLSRWYHWEPDTIFLTMTMEKASYYWSRGWLGEKMQAIRIAGHMHGKDIDAEMETGSDSGRETTYDAIENFFMGGGMVGGLT